MWFKYILNIDYKILFVTLIGPGIDIGHLGGVNNLPNFSKLIFSMPFSAMQRLNKSALTTLLCRQIYIDNY